MDSQTVDVIQLFKDAAFEITNKRMDGVDRRTVITQLGMDSVSVMELVSSLEERLKIRMPDEELARINTIGDLGAAIQKLMPTAKVMLEQRP